MNLPEHAVPLRNAHAIGDWRGPADSVLRQRAGGVSVVRTAVSEHPSVAPMLFVLSRVDIARRPEWPRRVQSCWPDRESPLGQPSWTHGPGDGALAEA